VSVSVSVIVSVERESATQQTDRECECKGEGECGTADRVRGRVRHSRQCAMERKSVGQQTECEGGRDTVDRQ
jgi:hypothetical protein